MRHAMAHSGGLRRGTWYVGGRFEGTGLCSACAGPFVMESMVTLQPCGHVLDLECWRQETWWREGDLRCSACYTSIHRARMFPSGELVYVDVDLFPPPIVPRDPLKVPQ